MAISNSLTDKNCLLLASTCDRIYPKRFSQGSKSGLQYCHDKISISFFSLFFNLSLVDLNVWQEKLASPKNGPNNITNDHKE